MSIRSLDDVRPGDFMISGQNTAPNKLLVYAGQILMKDHFRVGQFVAGHAGIVTPGGKLVEAMPRGARERDLRETDWSPGHAYFRLLEDYPGQALDACVIARAMVGTRYSFMSYGYIGAYLAAERSDRFDDVAEKLAKHIDRRRDPVVLPLVHQPGPTWNLGVRLPLEAICSVLAEQCWTLTGKKVIVGTKPQVVTPGMLTNQLWNGRGVLRGGAGILS